MKISPQTNDNDYQVYFEGYNIQIKRDVIVLTHAVIDPLTMMVKFVYTRITYVAMPGIMRVNCFAVWA